MRKNGREKRKGRDTRKEKINISIERSGNKDYEGRKD